QITIDASPNRTDRASSYLQTILTADGTRMDRYGQYVKAQQGGVKEIRGPIVTPDTSKRPLKRPGGEPNISGDWAPVQAVMVDPRGTGSPMVQLSQLSQYKAGERPANAAGVGGARRGGAGTGPRLYGGSELTEA